MSPEQVTGDRVTAVSDIYSLGIVMYELLLGRLPFNAKRLHLIAFKRINEDPPSPTSLNPDFPPTLETVLLKALARDPQQRFQTAGEFSVAYASAVKAMLPAARQIEYWVDPPKDER